MIDAYAHCGLNRYEPVERVLQTMTQVGVDRTVLVQHLGEYDNRYLAEAVVQRPDTFAAVALIDPERPDWRRKLERIVDSAVFRGLRMTTNMLRANRSLAAEATAAGLAIVLYTPNGLAEAMGPIDDLAAAAGDRPVIVTHLGCPRVEGRGVTAGLELLDLHHHPNVMVTLSGQAMFCPYPYRPLDAFIREVLATFTSHRVMWGSNYPVAGDAAAVRNDLQLLLTGSWGLTKREVAQITNATAAAVFFDAAR